MDKIYLKELEGTSIIYRSTPEKHDHTPSPPPIIDGHEYVDLGLPSGTKWATMNLGAQSETGYGSICCYGSPDTIHHYTGAENPLPANKDVITQQWGDKWHTPTNAQFEELINNTNLEFTEIDGVKGVKFINKLNSSKYMFLPACGYYNEDYGYRGRGEFAYYSSSSPYWASLYYTLYFRIANSTMNTSYITRYWGAGMRGVSD